MEVYTIGFTQRSAEDFFGALKGAGIRRLIDVRLNNTSQLAAFAKRDDLEFFLSEICGADYVHVPEAAPTQDLLKSYRNGDIDWPSYTERFLQLMEARRIEQTMDWGTLLDRPSVLLCSERTADRCHRRLVVEYLAAAGWDVTARHL